MASRQAGGGAGQAGLPVADRPEAIRNVLLVGRSRSGQDHARRAPAGHRRGAEPAGRTEDGTTVCDFEDIEHRQQRSVGLALAPLVHDGVKVNLLDSPGYVDFVGEVRAGLRAADCALFVIAANEGVDEPTRCCGASAPRWPCRGRSW